MGPVTGVALERDGSVATLRLTAPEKRNALTVEVAEAMIAACEEIDADTSIGAVVVTGGAFFCAGGNRRMLAEAGRDPAAPEAFEGLTKVYRSFARVGELAPPTVAAVRGGAVGAGLNLMLATDLRIVAEDAKVISGFLPIGLHPGGGHGALLGRTGAREATAALALFGEPIDGRRAAELGLAWRALPDDEVEPAAAELAARAGRDPELARRTAATLRMNLGPPAVPWAVALEAERATQMWSLKRSQLLSDT